MSKDNDHIRAVNTVGATRRPEDLPSLVCQIRDNSLSILLSHLDQLFSSCDDLFFDLSSRAANNNEQNLYFESMRELRIKKNGIITQYRHQIDQLFADCNSPPLPPEVNTASTHPEDSLSLVQHDEIEQDVAINSMVSKARVNNQEALHQLNVRLDYLLTSKTIDANNNPLDPQQLCRSFATACELLDINIKAKIILYKQFERLVVSRLASLYSNANDLLINAGVIPRVSRSVTKNPTPTGPETDTLIEDLQEAAFQRSDIQFDELSQLLASLRALGIQQLPGYQVYSTNPGPLMSNQELLTAITLLQQQFNASTEDLYIHQLIREVLSQSNPQTPQSIQQTDEDIINLVAMFFDFVLDDRNLPIAVQALIGRLQIPILKVALKDQNFFNNSNHPARKLVNRLAEISIGLDDGADLKEDRTFQTVATIVQDVQENYSTDSNIFATKLQELEKFASRDLHRSELIEKRTNQAEEGKAKTEEAQQATQSLLLEKLRNAMLPHAIFDFLVIQWQQLLKITHLKYGEESPEWLDAAQLVQDLIWACQPQQDEKARQRLAKIKGHLMARISTGLAAITMTGEQAEELSQGIAKIIDLCQHPTHTPRTSPLSQEQAQALGHTPGAGTKSWQDMTALERQQTRHKQLTYEYIKKAEDAPLNTWFLYEDISSGQLLRCKLSARIEASDLYIFVNRLGFKVLKKSRKDFAYDLQKGQARKLHTEPLFDRALARIRSKLKQPTASSHANA